MNVYMIGKTEPDWDEIRRWLMDRGFVHSLEGLGVDVLIEMFSRGCYNSFEGTDNKNIGTIRSSNAAHLANIIKVGHGSVLEHVVFNFQFTGVSRVLTHELVRHRHAAISQESMRYVRLGAGCAALDLACPDGFPEDVWRKCLKGITDPFGEACRVVDELCEGENFGYKKKITSSLRRLAPGGVLTNIGWSANVRHLRHVLHMRTDPAAEREIRVLFNKVWECVKHYNCMTCEVEEVDGLLWVKAGRV